jgi:hypothetical protein
MLRLLAVATAVAALGLALVTTEASARQGGRSGFSAGFRGAGPSFRGAGPGAFRSFSAPRAFRGGFAGPQVFRGVGPGVRFANPGFRRHHGFRRFGPAFIGLPFALGAYGAYSAYSDYDDCVVPQNVMTPYGWQLRYVNVCNDYYPY